MTFASMAAARNADWASSCVTAPLIAPAQASSAKTKGVPLTTGQFEKRISRASVADVILWDLRLRSTITMTHPGTDTKSPILRKRNSQLALHSSLPNAGTRSETSCSPYVE